MAPNINSNTNNGGRTSATPPIERMEYGLPRSAEDLSSNPNIGAAALPPFQSVANGKFAAVSPAQSQGSDNAGQEINWAKAAAELEARLARENMEARQAIAVAREEGRREGQHAAEAALSAHQQQNQARIAATLEAFRVERQRYFTDVEREVVRLALSIAARVLHREAQLDPLFLAGAVRVALDKLADTSGVVLRVTPGQVLVWQEMFRLNENASAQPEILGDLSLPPGECVLETRLGTIEVGVRAQLEEIEKGFFDLLDQRPSSIAGMVKRAV
jgi:flagellar assembly protein FliH